MSQAAVDVMQPTIPFARTQVCDEGIDAAAAILRSGWLTTGPETAAFEADMSNAICGDGSTPLEVVAVSSCSAALEIALRGLHLPVGSPILTPALTFCGAVQAIVHAGLRPVLVDVDEVTLVPNEATVGEAARRAGAAAGMVVQHMGGYPAPVRHLAAAAGVPLSRVVEDAAHGLGAADDGEIGTYSAAACLSFYATKNLPIGEGGALCTTSSEMAEWARRARLHGISRDAWRRRDGAVGSWRYEVTADGIKANLTDMQAAIGRAQLKYLPAWQERRGEIASRYDLDLARISGIRLPARPTAGRHAWHLYQVRIEQAYGLSRDELIEALAARGIGTSVHFIPVHHLTYLRSVVDPQDCVALPNTDAVAASVLSLPMHPWLTDSEVEYICNSVAELGR